MAWSLWILLFLNQENDENPTRENSYKIPSSRFISAPHDLSLHFYEYDFQVL